MCSYGLCGARIDLSSAVVAVFISAAGCRGPEAIVASWGNVHAVRGALQAAGRCQRLPPVRRDRQAPVHMLSPPLLPGSSVGFPISVRFRVSQGGP
ncbi:hypothetical protein BU14_2913s0001 [Porphyra umbilicalis]|uniref:Uncharacterized protein n=1 Tax=Porphyra umbilicalis TaxID=2786 RepID=A0A1X6NID8_PORUM|nr:hypothetical protein BU14_2913s0001 [Porphyra umbilicalis]|eukprot:OSX68375.1 hypothetical protein BU14_2913s0001 [Porphyra umbilicalis]